MRIKAILTALMMLGSTGSEVSRCGMPMADASVVASGGEHAGHEMPERGPHEERHSEDCDDSRTSCCPATMSCQDPVVATYLTAATQAGADAPNGGEAHSPVSRAAEIATPPPRALLA